MSWQSSPRDWLRQSNDTLIQLIKANERLEIEINKCYRVEKVLLATKIQLKRLLSFSPAIIYSRQANPPYALTFVSESINQLGYTAQQFFTDEQFWLNCIHPEDAPLVLAKLQSLGEAESLISEYRCLNSQGQYCWILDRSTLICDEEGNQIEIIGAWQDITEIKRIEQALFQEKELAQVTLASINDGVITTNSSGEVEYLNPMAERLTGWNLDSAKGNTLDIIFPIVRENDHSPIDLSLEQILSSGETTESEEANLLISPSGEEYIIAHSIAPIHDREGQILGCVLIFRDITKPRTLNRQLSWQANHDALTGLVNRMRFEQLLEEAITAAKVENIEHILCYLDLDQFKVVNDTCGHLAGDELLRQLAVLLKNQVRNSDVVARLGGDEFGILLPLCPLEIGEQIAQKIRSKIQDFRFLWQNNTFRIGVSIGLVTIDTDTNNLNTLLSAADAACFAAKEGGRNRVHIYQANDLEVAQQRAERQWIGRLTQALEENRFSLYCQSIVPISYAPDSPTNYRYHTEILIRLMEPNGEIIPPMAFIPAAERYGLMSRLDRWVIETFFSNYLRLVEANSQSLYSINLSGVSINDDQLLPFIKDCFQRYQVPPTAICFEITETATIANLSRANQFIRELKEIGCYFALDDFGSGMSSFVYLKNLPVDFLKIDGYFIKNILNNPVDSVMVECIHRIGQAIGIQTIAESVESEAIIEKLRELGIDHVQGYYIANPLPLLD
jgi:diguanylate cyclase (GGDEF)-like protein/PAS domain S-box-containing protein